MARRSAILITIASFSLTLSACVTTARLHELTQLNDVALSCGLALGDVFQDESEKRLLISMRHNASAEQRACGAKWAKRNRLTPVSANMSFDT